MGIEGGAQVSAYSGGKLVVDLWGVREGTLADERYDGNSLQNVFSSSKVVTSLVVAMLADRGHLRYDQPISEIWPEFGSNGKHDTTVAELMRHEAGLPEFNNAIPLDDADTAGVKAGKLSALIARQTPRWGSSKRSYHGLTRGWIANEIVVRSDPLGRTIGEFVQQEIVAQLKDANSKRPPGLSRDISLLLGISQQDRSKVNIATLGGSPELTSWAVLQSLLPSPWQLVKIPPGLAVVWPLWQIAVGGMHLLRCCGICPRSDDRRVAMSPRVGNGTTATFNHPRVASIEIPSANFHANSSTMAAVMNVLCGGGERDGVRFLSHAGLQAALGNPVVLPTFGPITTEFTNAGWNIYRQGGKGWTFPHRWDFVGWQGLGGSVMQFHPERDLAFAYAMTQMAPKLDPNARSWRLQSAFERCAARTSATGSPSSHTAAEVNCGP